MAKKKTPPRKATPPPTPTAPDASAPPPPVHGGLQELFLDELDPSPGNRELGDLGELVESVRAQGVLQPVLVRPHPKDEARYEVVAGHRRVEAARRAGLERVPALVRDLDDRQALEVQLVENLQRRDLHPLDEAEGYQALIERHGHTAETLAARVGRSKAYVYARLKLVELAPPARKAFRDGKLEASVALLVARVPGAELQKEAVRRLLEEAWGDRPLAHRDAAELVRREFMLDLGRASFDPKDAELLSRAGACGPCPKRTGNAPDLFGDVKAKDTCTDPKCFQAKTDADWARRAAAAREEGRKVLEGKAADKVLGYGSGWIRADEPVDGFKKSARQLLGKAAPPTTLARSSTGTVREVLPRAEVVAALRKAGHKPAREEAAGLRVDPQAEAARKARRRKLAGRAMVEACLEALRARSFEVVELLELHAIESADARVAQEVLRRRGVKGERDPIAALRRLAKDELTEVAHEVALTSGVPGAWDARLAREPLLSAGRLLSVNLAQVAKEAAKGATKAKAPGKGRR